MKFLFTDFEYCNGRDICEFGFVQTDERLDVIRNGFFIINPEAIFSLVSTYMRPDYKLAYKEDVYMTSSNFAEWYNELDKIVSVPGQLIVGSNIDEDARRVEATCKRYALQPFRMDCYDIGGLRDTFGDLYPGELLATDFKDRYTEYYESMVEAMRARDLLNAISDRIGESPYETLIDLRAYHNRFGF